MSNLVIVESPAKAKTIKKYLGKDFDVVASMGHVRDLPEARLCVDIKNNFTPRYEVIKGKEELVDKLKKPPRRATPFILRLTPTARARQFPGILHTCLAWSLTIKTG